MVRSRALLLTLSTSFVVAGSMYACGGDDTSPVNPPTDAGHDVTQQTDTGGGQDTSVPDTNVPDTNKPDSGPPKEHGKILIVHASPDAPAIRFCFGLGTKADGSDAQIAPQAPAPNVRNPRQPYAGLFAGTGGGTPDLLDFSNLAITPFIIPAETVKDETPDGGPDGGKEHTCTELVGATGGGGLLTTAQYYKLGTIPAQTILPETTTLIALTGCVGTAQDATHNTAVCGPDWTAGTRNLKTLVFKLDRVVADQTKTGAQVIHVAPAWDGVIAAQAGGPVAQVATIFTPDGGAPVAPVVGAPGVTYGKTAPDASASIATTAFDLANLFVVSAVQADGGVAANVPLPLQYVAVFTSGGTTSADGGAYFSAGENFAFVLVGNPAVPLLEADGGVNLYGPHVLAFPTNPPFATSF